MAECEKARDLAERLKAVAHPTRLQILCSLRKGMRCVNAIRELLGVRQPNVSQHLAVLRRMGWVGCKRNGASRCYYLLRPAAVEDLFHLLETDYAEQDAPPMVEGTCEKDSFLWGDDGR